MKLTTLIREEEATIPAVRSPLLYLALDTMPRSADAWTSAHTPCACSIIQLAYPKSVCAGAWLLLP